MGLLNAIMGNQSEVDIEKVQEQFSFILTEDEQFLRAYKLVRDMMVFTNKRLILVDKQGAMGKKKELLTIPYKNISTFSMETKGTFDSDSELKIWVRDMPEPLSTKFSKDEHAKAIYQILGEAGL